MIRWMTVAKFPSHRRHTARKVTMQTLAPIRFGIGLGAAWALFYVLCILAMRILPHDATIWLFNSFMHGLDVRSVVRWDIPWWESLIGVVESFVAGWLFGVVMATVYNLGGRSATVKPSRG